MRMKWILAPLMVASTAAMAQFDGPSPLAWRWSEATSVSPTGAPALDGDNVFVAVGGRLYGLDRATGNQLWRYPAGEPLTGNFRTGVIKAGDLILAASDQRILYAVNAKTGQLAWQFTAQSPIIGAPVATANEVVVPLSTGQVAGVSLRDGSPLWGGKPFDTRDRLFSNMATWGGGFIYLTPNSMHLVDANTGVRRWTQRFGRLNSTAVPVVFGDNIFVTTGTFLISLRAASGSARWQQNLNELLPFAPAVSNEGVLVMSENEKLYAYDLNGRPATRGGFDIEVKAGAAPSWAGRFAVVPSAGGTINLIDPKVGDRVWSYTIPQISRTSAQPAAGGGMAGGGALGGPAAGGGGGAQNAAQAIGNIPAAGPAVLAGSTLLLLAADGSLLAFDRTNGVDFTAPTVKMLWPSAGDNVSPNPPAELVFKVEDFTSGINPGSIKVTIGGAPYKPTIDRDGIVRIVISATGENKTLPQQRSVIKFEVSDWLGNASATEFVLLFDPTLDRPLGSPPRTTGGQQGGGGFGGGGMGGGSR